MWNLPPPPGFQGLHPDKPVTCYTRHLPHWRQEGASYFVTYRLHDSLPQAKLDELAEFRREWERRNKPPLSRQQLEDLAYRTMRRVEAWLDQGFGSCCLKDSVVAERVTESLHHFDGDRYELGCYVVMPNHVHVAVRPLRCQVYPLERILQSIKRYSSLQINRQLGRSGPLWQDDSFDRIIRDEEHLYRAIQYIGSNPRRAGITCPLWIRPEWVALGWKFETE